LKEASEHKFTNGFWIGYGIRRVMDLDSHIGSFGDSYGRHDKSLHELLYGQKEYPEDAGAEETIRREALRALDEKGRRAEGRKVVKGVAILFAYNRSSSGGDRLSKITISNLSLAVDLGDRPLLWLGNADDEESETHLQQQFASLPTTKLKESTLFAISIHDSSNEASAFLRKQLTEAEEERLRGSAAFWIGQRNRLEDLPFLVKAATTDDSRHVREQGVFAISQMRSERATEALIDLARNGPTREVRSKAIFWLSQKASEKVLPTLKGVVYGDSDSRLQREAVFALSRLKDVDGVKELIEIAKTHNDSKIRRQAIFWLGQSKDPRALNALTQMVRGK
jgi:hypothetical protein